MTMGMLINCVDRNVIMMLRKGIYYRIFVGYYD